MAVALGITLIYTYFQIPLMVLVFLPAPDGVKVQWREASENLGVSPDSTGDTSASRY